MKKKKEQVSNGHVTVARGMGGEGREVGSSQRSYDRWALGEGGGGGGKGGGPVIWARQARPA